MKRTGSRHNFWKTLQRRLANRKRRLANRKHPPVSHECSQCGVFLIIVVKIFQWDFLLVGVVRTDFVLLVVTVRRIFVLVEVARVPAGAAHDGIVRRGCFATARYDRPRTEIIRNHLNDYCQTVA